MNLSDGELVENYSEIRKFTKFLTKTNIVLNNLWTNSASMNVIEEASVNEYLALITHEDLDSNDVLQDREPLATAGGGCGHMNSKKRTNFFASSILSSSTIPYHNDNYSIDEIHKLTTNDDEIIYDEFKFNNLLKDCSAVKESTDQNLTDMSEATTMSNYDGNSSIRVLHAEDDSSALIATKFSAASTS